MRDELSHALIEALYELEVLPEDDDGALVGLYAVMDDLQAAIRRTEALDLPHRTALPMLEVGAIRNGVPVPA